MCSLSDKFNLFSCFNVFGARFRYYQPEDFSHSMKNIFPWKTVWSRPTFLFILQFWWDTVETRRWSTVFEKGWKIYFPKEGTRNSSRCHKGIFQSVDKHFNKVMNALFFSCSFVPTYTPFTQGTYCVHPLPNLTGEMKILNSRPFQVNLLMLFSSTIVLRDANNRYLPHIPTPHWQYLKQRCQPNAIN